MAKFTVNIAPEVCKGCELCISVCPKQVIEVSKSINARGYSPADAVRIEDCVGCTSCALVCPDGAIEIFKEDE
ncbi:MAG: 4Fe-4S dicluster domain-containing protein [Oscillospiraceae bacterium]|jgi:2-oxoglutarate ferredoxin oxidoreductase subunit delta|nr:4Fe-4S dicluster domain-containing protein [Oscillospiraceae bacterium]